MWKNQHITKNSDWNWWVKSENSSGYTKLFDTQSEAIQHWREIAKNQWSELLIHWANWKIRARDSYWNDPFPPRG